MDVPDLMHRLAAAEERRQSAQAGSPAWHAAQREMDDLADAIERASGGALAINTGVPVFEGQKATLRKE